jgi:hypothetical protein
MTLRNFIKKNRVQLKEYIKKACPNIGKINDEEIRMWVLNDEGYMWAKSEG